MIKKSIEKEKETMLVAATHLAQSEPITWTYHLPEILAFLFFATVITVIALCRMAGLGR